MTEDLPPETDDAAPVQYSMRLSRLTVDKLGVKLYDKASAVVAELIANAYDADAENVTVTLPIGTELAKKSDKGVVESVGHQVVVADDGHGMTPDEAQGYFLSVGSDRRTRQQDGALSREKTRSVMGRKGIGKLAPFGICKRIEVRSAGGPKTEAGYLVSHFVLEFDKIVSDEEGEVPIAAGKEDRTWSPTRGTTVTLSDFLPKRVPDKRTFTRQVARRFALAKDDFTIHIVNSRTDSDQSTDAQTFDIPKFQVEINEDTRLVVDKRPVEYDGRDLQVTGWLAFGKQAIKDEEEAGVRIYARGKIVATTRDFEQPAGFTGEFTMRSYLVGELHAEWLDQDDDEDLVRTDRQGILWDSEYGEALRAWGANLVKEIAKKSAGPRRQSKTAIFLKKANLETRAKERFGDNKAVLDAVMDFGKKIGGFSQEDELEDQDYVDDLVDVVLMVGPHQALIKSFQRISKQEHKTVEQLLPLFAHTRTAELASYAQIAQERVDAVRELEKVIHKADVDEADLQNLIARAPWLVRPDWSVITGNQGLKRFRDEFVVFWKKTYGEDINVAITYEKKRPDFTMVHLGNQLHIVELKKPGHAFANDDYDRLQNYLEAFEALFADHETFRSGFPDGWIVDLVADGVDIKDTTKRRAYQAAETAKQVVRMTWVDFLGRATTAHGQFLDTQDRAEQEGGDSELG